MLTILLIDDDEQIRSSFAGLLTRAGHSVRTAANGVQAVNMFRESLADIVITDIVMPEKDGYETIRELKELYPDVKILAISGGGKMDAAMALDLAGKLGAARILLKPFSGAELTFALSKLGDERQQ